MKTLSLIRQVALSSAVASLLVAFAPQAVALDISCLSLGDGFHHDMNGSIDDYFDSGSGVIEAGYFYDGDSSGRYTRRGYLQFDLSTLVQAVDSATLNLYVVGNHYLDNSPSAGHIRHRGDASSANGSASQRLAGDQAVVEDIQGLANNTWVSYDVTAFLQSDYSNGYDYAVFSVDPDTSGGGWRDSRLAFASADSANVPFLQITTIPEPAVATLLAGCLVAALVVLRRHNRS